MLKSIIFLPLIGSILIGLNFKVISNKFAQIISTTLMLISAILAIYLFYEVVFLNHSYELVLFSWLDISRIQINWVLKADSLSATMMLIVTMISFIVHLYSIEYMRDEPKIPKFMAYLSLFTFFMLALVSANNFIQLFFGWEGVGLCSYLLIGFWYHKESANNASMKAFIVNRIGDFSFIIAICIIAMVFNSLNFAEVFLNLSHHDSQIIEFLGFKVRALDLICILLFIGCMGKSAQLGLHTWLADAMEGPTPVSALIHAATMVTAGVFLVVRCSPIFEYSLLAKEIMIIIGSVTCLFAATIAMTQNDIKKIIAYSTCSQLGYMFFACGVSAYNGAIFHLMTHAFFKALLFLGAGSVIHATNGQQELNKLGGLKSKLPFTHLIMWIGSLALIGIYPFAGYFSKDFILEAAYAEGNNFGYFAFLMGLLAAFCTAFYSGRLIIKTFYGPTKLTNEQLAEVHEAPILMKIPLLLLAIGAILMGFVGQQLWLMIDQIDSFWHGSIMVKTNNNILSKIEEVSFIIKLTPVIVGISGILTAYFAYLIYPVTTKLIKNRLPKIYSLFSNSYYFDQLYETVLVKQIIKLSNFLINYFEPSLIRLGPTNVTKVTNQLGLIINQLQSGYLLHYALFILGTLAMIISWYILTIV